MRVYLGLTPRFVNDDKARRHNIRVLQIPNRNRWHHLYLASVDIAPGDELFVSYGSAYWKKREFY